MYGGDLEVALRGRHPSRTTKGAAVTGVEIRVEGALIALHPEHGLQPASASVQMTPRPGELTRSTRATVLSNAGPYPAITALTASIRLRTVAAFESSPRRSIASSAEDNLAMADERSISSCAVGSAPCPPTGAPANCSISPVSPPSPIRSRVPISTRSAVSIPRRVRSFGQLRPVSRLRIVFTSRTPDATATSDCVIPSSSRRRRANSAARRRPRFAARVEPGTMAGTIPGRFPVGNSDFRRGSVRRALS